MILPLIRRDGFIEFYFAFTLFLIVCAGTSVLAQKQMRLLKLEKAAWSAQDWTWENQKQAKSNPTNFDVLTFENKTPLTEKTNFKANAIKGLWGTLEIFLQYQHCSGLPEPASFLLYKNALYRHSESHLLFNAKDSIDDLPWIKRFSDFQGNQKELQTGFRKINQTFIHNGITSSGGILERLLWQEATLKTPYKMVPYEVIVYYELLQIANDIANFDLGANPFGKKAFKKALKEVTKEILDMIEIEDFAKDILTGKIKPDQASNTQNKKNCNQIIQPL